MEMEIQEEKKGIHSFPPPQKKSGMHPVSDEEESVLFEAVSLDIRFRDSTYREANQNPPSILRIRGN